MGSLGINIHDRTPDCHPDARMTSPLNVALIRNVILALDVLRLYFWHVIHGCHYNQALADVRSNGAGVTSVLYYKSASLLVHGFNSN